MRRRLTGSAFGWGPGWTARALALFRDDRFTDEEILTILRAGEAGLKLADVCAAGGIRVATYYDWKAKYSGLTPADVRKRRLRERRLRARRKRRALMAAFAALVVLSVWAAGTFGNPLKPRPTAPRAPVATVTIPGPAPTLRNPAVAGHTPPSPVVSQPARVVSQPAPVVSQPPGAEAAQPAGLRASATWVNAEDIETANPNGYVVQVAAVPNLEEARAVLAQLADAGYPAHLTATIVDRVELYRVRVGPLKSRPAAEEVARRLEREGHRAPWITK
jgi:putative transposase